MGRPVATVPHAGTHGNVGMDPLYLLGYKAKALTNQVETIFGNLAVASNRGASLHIEWSIEVQGANYQMMSGKTVFSATNKAGTLDVKIATSVDAPRSLTGGTMLVVDFKATANGNSYDLKVESNSSVASITSTSFKYNVRAVTDQAYTPN